MSNSLKRYKSAGGTGYGCSSIFTSLLLLIGLDLAGRYQRNTTSKQRWIGIAGCLIVFVIIIAGFLIWVMINDPGHLGLY